MEGYNVFVKNRSVSFAGDGTYVYARGTPDGSCYVAPFNFGYAIDGRLFGASFGSVSTPLATPATTSITAQRPQAWIRVPSGTLVVPARIAITVESAGATTQGEIALATSQNDVGNGTSSAGPTPVCLNADATRTSNCTARQLATGDVTAEVGLHEFDRFSFAASAANQKFVWSAQESGLYMPLMGDASLLIYIGGNAVNFFADVQWYELTSTDFD